MTIPENPKSRNQRVVLRNKSNREISPVVDTHFNPGLLGSGRDYEEEYYNDLESIFEYSFYKEGDHISVKLSVDYIKHHTAVATIDMNGRIS